MLFHYIAKHLTFQYVILNVYKKVATRSSYNESAHPVIRSTEDITESHVREYNPTKELLDKVHSNNRIKVFECQITYTER